MKTYMQVSFKDRQRSGKIQSNRKENNFYNQYTLITPSKDGELKDVIQARFYITNSRVYCCVWIHASEAETWVSGGGFAGGYGYHKPSAALQAALNDAGITLGSDIAGHGDGAMENALESIGVALGYKNFKVFNAHA